MKTWAKRAVWIGLAALAIFVVVRALQPVPVLVDVATVERGDVLVTVDDDGRTRVRERFVVSSPVAGRLARTPLDPGDPVVAGETVVGVFEPVLPPALDARSRAQAEVRVRAAEEAVEAARALVAQAELDADFAAEEVERLAGLVERGADAARNLDRAERDRDVALAGLRAARSRRETARLEVELARAALTEPAVSADTANGAVHATTELELRSPIDGVVLRVLEESARTVPAGAPLLEIGDLADLEIVADYLSQDAVRVAPGMPVRVEGWASDGRVLAGRVRRVEPSGRTKISALGVEEQRVDVLIDPVVDGAGDAAEWSALGDGYRVDLSIVLDEARDVLVLPTGALFREGDAWWVFVVAEGLAQRREVELGRRNGLEAEVLTGLAAGEHVVLYPSELVEDGGTVEAR